METIAVAILGFFTLGYFLLGGADIGVGMVLPFLGRTDRERRLVVTAIAPFFLGNEVWLVAVIGILAGAFPELEATLLHGLYPAFSVLLVGWVVRDMGLWLRGRVDRRGWRLSWDAATVTGSWLVALSWGVVLGEILAGDVGGPGAAGAAVAGAAGAAPLFASHGLAFAALRLTGAPHRRARRAAGRIGEARMPVVTSAVITVAVLAAGVRLEPARAAADPGSLSFLVPAILVVTPFLVAAQAWSWYLFRHRVTEPVYL
ncbi:cytochrome d ubiquinol oxidase subunit II [Streptosporangium sp. NPDC002524]|uniref:cytochrome d ubiquinol oxidase subunit II n=1 Tax=Streptosporangium sp. NPDC002524 TaxID=3154537 RepID=UPI00331E3AEA